MIMSLLLKLKKCCATLELQQNRIKHAVIVLLGLKAIRLKVLKSDWKAQLELGFFRMLCFIEMIQDVLKTIGASSKENG